MAEGVAEVEQRPPALGGQFAFVRLDDARLQFTAAADHRRQVRTRCGERCALQLGQKRGVAQQAVFDDLGRARGEFARGQGREEIRVDEHPARLVKGAREVFSRGEIDAGFAADRTVDHGQQGRRHLEKIDAPQITRGRKSAEIADHASAHRPEHARAIQSLRRQKFQHPPQLRDRLRLFTRRNDQHGHVAKPRFQGCGLAVREGAIRQDGDFPAGFYLPGNLGPDSRLQIRSD